MGVSSPRRSSDVAWAVVLTDVNSDGGGGVPVNWIVRDEMICVLDSILEHAYAAVEQRPARACPRGPVLQD